MGNEDQSRDVRVREARRLLRELPSMTKAQIRAANSAFFGRGDWLSSAKRKQMARGFEEALNEVVKGLKR